ncbi:MAG: hypothetical protein GY754_39005 [bacterium]|nr:hypothetical protein [bacterium]
MKNAFKSKIHISAWVGSIALVIITGLYYIPHEYEQLTFWETMYCIMRLFVFERDLAAFPRAWPLIAVYFAAPLITLSALGTFLSYLLRSSPGLRARWMSGHVIICGVGGIGKILAGALRENGITVIGIDNGNAEEFSHWAVKNKVSMIYGDFLTPGNLKRAGAFKARSVIFACGSDLANIEGAFAAYELLKKKEGPVRLIWSHIADDRLADTLREAVQTEGSIGIRFFDTYQIAAVRMINGYLDTAIVNNNKEYNITGFGKFGSDLLEVLVQSLGRESDYKIRVFDKQDKSGPVNRLARFLSVEDRVKFIQKDIRDIEDTGNSRGIYFLSTDDDLGNLTLALMLSARFRKTYIFVRMAHWPLHSVAEHIGDTRGIVFVNINDLISHGLQALPGIFEPAREVDLKRIKK